MDSYATRGPVDCLRWYTTEEKGSVALLLSLRWAEKRTAQFSILGCIIPAKSSKAMSDYVAELALSADGVFLRFIASKTPGLSFLTQN